MADNDFSTHGCGLRPKASRNRRSADFDGGDERNETSNREHFIVNGKVSKITNFPWATFLVAGYSKCGATLIHHRAVLTAAHCTYGFEGRHLTSLFGCTYIDLDEEKVECEYARDVDENIVHPDYERTRGEASDIALLKLTRSVDNYNSRVRPACLPPLGSGQPGIGTDAYAAGFGRTGGDKPGSPKIKEARMRVVSIHSCAAFYGHNPDLLETYVCAQGISGSTCYVSTYSF